jgi:hypothetical protein
LGGKLSKLEMKKCREAREMIGVVKIRVKNPFHSNSVFRLVSF